MTSNAIRQVTISHGQGLHMRPADLLVRMVSSFDSNVQLVKDGYAADCDSIMSLLTLGAENGAQLTLKAEGKDAEDAVEKIAAW
ncbi:MAG: HPr family phosphocarrier protein, partial [Planctomycetota bacterium]